MVEDVKRGELKAEDDEPIAEGGWVIRMQAVWNLLSLLFGRGLVAN